MTEAGTPLPEQFTLTAPPPVRALAIAGVAAIVGAVCIVGRTAVGLPLLLTVVGVALVVLAVALAVTALVLSRRLRTVVVLESDTITAAHAGHTRSVPWSAVDEVLLQGPHLVLVGRERADDLEILNPRTPEHPSFRALITSVQEHLDRNRGYTPFS